MKLWKRTAACLLCLGFGVSAFACGDNTKNSQEISNGNNTTSTGDNGTVDFNKAQSLADALKDAKSGKIKVTLETVSTNAEGTANEEIGLDITVSEADSGVNAKVTVNDKAKVVSELYAIDGWAYIKVGNEYTVSPKSLSDLIQDALADAGVSLEEIGGLLGQLEGLLGGAVNGEEAGASMSDLGAAFGEYFESSAKLENGAMVVTLDGSDALNGVLGYIGGMTAETTVGEIVNDGLALIDPTLKAEDILEMLSTLGTVTVEEAYTYIDDIVKEETGYSIQNLKNVLLMNEEVQALLLQAGMTEEMIEDVETFDVEEYLIGEESPYKTLTLNQLIGMIVEANTAYPDEQLPEDQIPENSVEAYSDSSDSSSEIEEEIDYVGEYVMMAEEFLNMTLADVETAYGVENLVVVLQTIGSVSVDDASVKYGVKYDKNMQIDALILGLKGQISRTVENVTYVEGVEIALTVSEFSEEKVTIALPEGATLIYTCADCGESETASYREEYNAYVCDDCYPSYGYVECEYCGEKDATCTWREDMIATMCDDCYALYNQEMEAA